MTMTTHPRHDPPPRYDFHRGHLVWLARELRDADQRAKRARNTLRRTARHRDNRSHAQAATRASALGELLAIELDISRLETRIQSLRATVIRDYGRIEIRDALGRTL